MVPLTLVNGNRSVTIRAIVDSEYTGTLCIRPEIARKLQLKKRPGSEEIIELAGIISSYFV